MREKIQIFVFGLSVGLLAGCLFFIFKLDGYVRKIDLLNLSSKQNVTEQVVVSNMAGDKEKTADKNISKNIPNNKTGNLNDEKYESVISVNNINDSAYINSENFQVLKEELISVKNLYVKTLVPAEKINGKDSLIASLAGVTTPAPEEFFMIEFWKTPLNSKGYKMSRNRLLIYGYSEKTDLALIKTNDAYYLRNNSIVYKLNYSSEFKPLERSSESDLAGKFN